ncbi:MAG TPA: sulfite exporter TauE/SafE family protein [Longimicrobiales bacterium]
METLLPLLTALLLGSVHAIEADHVAAVSSFAVRRPRPGAAMLFGLRWALGHGGVVILLGMAFVLLGIELPEAAGHWLERLVGVGLVALGAWTLASARTMHAHLHTHADGTTHFHLHSHLTREDHHHGHAATAMGALHGLAGTAPVVALIPLAGLGSPVFAAGYLLLFAIGTAAGMAVFAMLAGWIAGRAAGRSARLARAIAWGTGVITVALGLVWLFR